MCFNIYLQISLLCFLKPSSVSYLFPCYYSWFIYLCFFSSPGIKWLIICLFFKKTGIWFIDLINDFSLLYFSWPLVPVTVPSQLSDPFSTSMDDPPLGTMSWNKLHLLFKPFLSRCLVTAVINSNYYTTQMVQVISGRKSVTRGPKRNVITRVLDKGSQSPLRPKSRTW